MKELFLLNKNITYFNHGSFGACPKEIFEDYQSWQHKLEYEPVNFITTEGKIHIQTAKNQLAKYINCNPHNLAFTINPSYALNSVLKSLDLKKGDEILTTNLEYGAMDMAWEYYCNKSQAKYVKQPISLPLIDRELFIKEFFKGLTDKTKVVFISAITSSTALILPYKEICAIAKEKDLITIVDGAHVPAHVDLDLSDDNIDFFAGACHKWMLTPKGCSFLYVNKRMNHIITPLIISWGYDANNLSDNMLSEYFDYQGTNDCSAFLTLPKALEFLSNNSWDNVAQQCRTLIKENYNELCEIAETSPLCNHKYLGQMCSFKVNCNEPDKLKQILYNKYKIEIPVIEQNDNVYIRLSVQAYNNQEDIDKLKRVLKEILPKTK